MAFEVGDIIQESEYLHDGSINKNRPTAMVLDIFKDGSIFAEWECTGICYRSQKDVIWNRQLKNYTKVF